MGVSGGAGKGAGRGRGAGTHAVFAAGLLEGAQHQRRAAVLLQVPGQVLPGHAARAALVGAGHGVARTLVLVALGAEAQVSRSPEPLSPPCRDPHGGPPPPLLVSPGWCRRRTPWSSRRRAGCAWGTRPAHAGAAGTASYGRRTCSRSTRSPAGRRLGGSGGKSGAVTTARPPVPVPPRARSAHLVGLAGEVAAAELAAQPALGAVVLQVGRQVAALQLQAAAVGAGDHVEAAGVEMGLGGAWTGIRARARQRGRGMAQHPPALTWRCLTCPLQRQPSSLWMQRMVRLSTCDSSSGSG